MTYWDRINSPADLKGLSKEELKTYAEEVRRHIIDTVRIQGGHLASNLGAVELTVALHYVFDTPEDKLLFDVGHQSYTHKIITGRKDSFDKIRSNGGISGFPVMRENENDAFTMGHASTSLSLAMGMSRGRDALGQDYHIVSVIGDGAFTGGMAFEALNDIGASRARVIIVLNDNKMSISKNVGAMSNYLTKLRMSKRYSRIKFNIKKGVSALPFFGDKLVSALDRTKDKMKTLLLPNKMFEDFGLKYFGPFDGHNIANLIKIFEQVKDEKKPVLIHVVTSKGYGLPEAETNPSKYHGLAPVAAAEKPALSNAKIVGEELSDMADKNNRVVAVTAAMPDGTGLYRFAQRHPGRYYDVGIAEEHAATMCAGLAAAGMKPYFAVYSTFLQRSFDQILHDVCINRLPVTFLIDRAGAAGADGVTHQGIFDLSYLNIIPDITIAAPKDGTELKNMLRWSETFNGPLAIRYHKDYPADDTVHAPVEAGKWEILKAADSPVWILASGSRMIAAALGAGDVNVVNARFIRPLDKTLLNQINKKGNLVITMEDNIRRGGFGEAVAFYYNGNLNCSMRILAHPNEFLYNFDVTESLAASGLTSENLDRIIKNFK